jgi:L-alanine-DL-glutamate epimerase-like enolase superfamily enzyme
LLLLSFVSGFVSSVKLELRRLDLRLTHSWTIARTRGMDSFTTVLLDLLDGEGIRGVGEAAPVAMAM